MAHTHKDIEKRIKELFILKKGRIHRGDFFLVNMFTNGVDRFAEWLETLHAYAGYAIIPIYIFTIYLSVCAGAKRFRDMGLSAWWLVPYLGILFTLLALIYAKVLTKGLMLGAGGVILVMILIPLFTPPQKHDNKYGEYDPASIWDSTKTKDKGEAGNINNSK